MNGQRRDLSADVVEGNLTYRPFDERRFIEDLRTSRAVLSGGGFTLMSEAVYLHKPVLSVPVEGQFEQVLNALYLENLGYGAYVPALSAEAVQAFLARLDRYDEALCGYAQEGNHEALATLDALLERAREQKGRWRIATE
jgi:uncharacterized protein (TIGR00661 family)